MDKKQSVLKEKSFAFAVSIVTLYKSLCDVKREIVISKQLLRSGTAIGALVHEAQNAESRADFIHKLGIAQKENDETLYWLELLMEAGYLEVQEFLTFSNEATGLLRMIRSSILTSKNNIRKGS